MDAIRGIAICGIVFPNMLCLLDPDRYFLGVAARWPEAHDRAALAFVTALFANKMISMLAFLFGVGIAWQIRKLQKFNKSPRKFLFRRFLALALIGAGNYILFFEGDILVTLSITGIFAAMIIPTKLFKRTRIVALAIWTYFILCAALMATAYALGWMSWEESEITDEAWQWFLYGNYDDTVYYRLSDWSYYPYTILWALSETLPLALVGALFFNTGMWQVAARSPKQVFPIFKWCAVSGVFLEAIYLIVSRGGALGPDPANPVAAWLMGFTALGSLLLALAYALGLRMLFSSADWLRRFAWFSHVGRLALSVYVMQNIVLGLLFYGYGAGLMETTGPLACIGIGVALNAIMLLVVKVYTSHFEQGPLERLWRILSYGWKRV